MMGTYRKILTLLLITTIFIVQVNAADAYCSDTKEYVKKVHDLNIDSKYPELNTIKIQIKSSLQGKCLNKETKDYVNLFVKISNSFGEVHSLSKSDIPEKHGSAIVKAESIWVDIDKLEKYDEAKEKYYPLLIRLSLRNFFKDEAEYFSNKEKNENKTVNKIEFSINEGIAYKNIGDPKYAEISYRADEMKSSYEYDVKLITGALKESNSFIKTASKTKDFSSSIVFFVNGYQYEESLTNAIQLSDNHGESQYKSQAETLIEKIGVIKQEASGVVLKNMAILCLIYLIGTIYMSWSITRWKDELYNVDLGDNLLGGLILE